VRLLSHGARRTYKDVILVPERRLPAGDAAASTTTITASTASAAEPRIVPDIPSDLMDELVDMDEAGRVQQWVRSLFEEDDGSSVTQLAVWQTYQATFSAVLKAHGKPQIQPAKFIQTSVGVYDGSQAQVTKPDESGQQKFIIRGIRPRLMPVSTSGREYQRCLWSADAAANRQEKCGRFFLDSEPLWRHILEDHLGEMRAEPDGYRNDEKLVQCTWAYCAKHPAPTVMPLSTFARHILVHTAQLWSKPAASSSLSSSSSSSLSLSSSSAAPQTLATTPTAGESPSHTGAPSASASASSSSLRKPWVTPAQTFKLPVQETATTRDERNPGAAPQAGGVPLSAALVLRNMARNAPKTDAEDELLKTSARGGGWNERLFRLVLPRLHEVHAQNKALVRRLRACACVRGRERERALLAD
jgi:chromatin structure-remodeling complex subunit RSC9